MANINNLQDSGLFTYGTYDSVNSVLNLTPTTIQIAGATGLSGTFSTSGTHIATVVNGLITKIV